MRARLPALLVAAALTLPVLGVAAHAAPPPSSPAPQPPKMVTVTTMPPVPGFTFTYAGKGYRTGADGSVQVPQGRPSDDLRLTATTSSLELPDGVVARFDRWYGQGRLTQPNGRAIATLKIYKPVTLTFVDLEGAKVRRTDLGTVTVKASTGYHVDLPADSGTTLLQASRVVPDNQGLEIKQLYFTVQDVDVQGNNVVNRSQTKFFPETDRDVTVPLLFFDATVRARDAFFGFGLSGTLHLTYPSGRSTAIPLGEDGRVALPGLARGQYELAVEGPGLRLSQPVAMSRRQDVDLKVFTWLDVGVTVVVGLVVSLGLLWAGHVLHGRRRAGDGGRPGRGRGRRRLPAWRRAARPRPRSPRERVRTGASRRPWNRRERVRGPVPSRRGRVRGQVPGRMPARTGAGW